MLYLSTSDGVRQAVKGADRQTSVGIVTIRLQSLWCCLRAVINVPHIRFRMSSSSSHCRLNAFLSFLCIVLLTTRSPKVWLRFPFLFTPGDLVMGKSACLSPSSCFFLGELGGSTMEVGAAVSLPEEMSCLFMHTRRFSIPVYPLGWQLICSSLDGDIFLKASGVPIDLRKWIPAV